MLLNKIDLLSPSITLYTNGKLRHSSLISGILTVFTYMILIGFGFYFALELIQRQNPLAFYFNRYAKDVGSFLLNSDSMFNFIQILDIETNLPVPVDFDSFRIFGFREYIESYYTSNRDISQYDHWLYGNCNNDSDTKGIEYLITMDHFNESACIRKYYNKEEKKYYNTNEQGFIWPSLDKGCSHPNRTFYGIIIEQCRNDSLKNDCKPIEKIKKYAWDHSVNFQIIDHYADVYNYDEPLAKYFYSVSNGIFTDSFTTNHLNFNPIVIKTHKGFIFENQIEELSYTFDQNEKVTTSWEANKEGIYVAFYFWMQNRIQYNERTYETVQDVLANIGGLCSSVILIMTILNKLISNYITILDTEKILTQIDHKIADMVYSIGKIFPEDFKKTQIYFEKKVEKKNNPKKNGAIEKIYNSTTVNNAIKNDSHSNQYICSNNFMSNNYLTNNNNLVKVLNKENKILTPIKKIEEYQPIKKNSFNFFDYLLFVICKKRNQFLNYEKFRRKVLSEEYIIQNYFDVYKLLCMPGNQNEAII